MNVKAEIQSTNDYPRGTLTLDFYEQDSLDVVQRIEKILFDFVAECKQRQGNEYLFHKKTDSMLYPYLLLVHSVVRGDFDKDHSFNGMNEESLLGDK